MQSLLFEVYENATFDGTRGLIFRESELMQLPTFPRALEIAREALITASCNRKMFDGGGGHDGDPKGYVQISAAMLERIEKGHMIMAAELRWFADLYGYHLVKMREWYWHKLPTPTDIHAGQWNNIDFVLWNPSPAPRGTLIGGDYAQTTRETCLATRAKKKQLCQTRLLHKANTKYTMFVAILVDVASDSAETLEIHEPGHGLVVLT